MKTTKIELTRVNNDVYGNPRYVCHLLNIDNDSSEYPNTNKSIKLTIGPKRCIGRHIEVTLNFTISLTGANIYIQSDNKIIPSGHHAVESNLTFEAFDLETYFIKHIYPKYFYTEGVMEALQYIYNCPKEDVPNYYKNLWHSQPEEVDIYKSLTHRILKKLNIQVKNQLTIASLKHILSSQSRRTRKTPLYKLPSVFELYDMIAEDTDCDTDFEQAYFNFMSENYEAHAILI
jgi:hypothetical protein